MTLLKFTLHKMKGMYIMNYQLDFHYYKVFWTSILRNRLAFNQGYDIFGFEIKNEIGNP